jgi:hypothetical protein
MGKIISYLIGNIGFGWLIKGAYFGLVAVYVTAVLAIFASLVVAFFYFYDLIQSLLTYISGSNITGTNLDYFFGLLNCIGFTSALNDSSSILIGGVIFILARIAAQIAITTYRKLLDSAKSAANLFLQ